MRCLILWDPYSTNIGLLTSILIFLLGREQVGKVIQWIGKLLKVDLRSVPHSDDVPEYHVVQLRAEALTHDYINQYFFDSRYQMEPFYKGFGIEKRSLDSITLKDIGFRLLTLIENIQVAKELGYSSINVLLEHDSFPAPLMDIVQRSESVTFDHWKPWDFMISASVAYTVALFRWIQLVPRLWKSEQLEGMSSESLIAVEFVDPDCAKGRATEPNYLSKHGYPASSMLAYVRREQVRRVGSNREYHLQDNINVLYLRDVPLTGKQILAAWRVYMSSAAMIKIGKRSILLLRRYLDEIDLAIDLDALFSHYHPKVHIYNTIPNGRATTRYDSGIVTGLCRQYGVRSLTYQSRVYYRRNVYYSFDVFDEFFMWGESWVEAYQSPQFVETFTVVGNVGLDSYSIPTIKGPNSNGIDIIAQPVLAVFTSDIDTLHPLHYTFDYTHRFMLAVLEAVGRYHGSDGAPFFAIHLKPKDPEHVEILLENSEIKALLNKYNINLKVIANKRHDIESVIDAADRVISIGFTTPGLDALGRGKPSIYFTPYAGIYNSIFNSGDTHLVAHDVDEIIAFLSGRREVSDKVMNDVQYLTEVAVGPRLVLAIEQAIKSEVMNGV